LNLVDTSAMKNKSITHSIAGYCSGLMLIAALIGCAAPRASLTNPNIQHFGNFTEMSKSGNTAGRASFSEVNQVPGTWGIGALAGLHGEALLFDGKLLISRGNKELGTVEPSIANDQALLWVSTKVTRWQEFKVPEAMKQWEFEGFVIAKAEIAKLDLSQPFAFRVTGSFEQLVWHVVNGAKVGGGHAQKKVFKNPAIAGQFVGFYSGSALEGIVTHPGERFHAHYIDNQLTKSGHVDAYTVNGNSTLWIAIP
jgi:alpha-acetolactate decarboxylase